ncbi:glycoside hydrolase family 9 protein [Deminuibacter soli]|uniref:Glycosyl transferase n=1 Tax=Deminuibacter soli TaxID=2291815 RepID=A0A3E1NCL6_9BACT|nr:glycoside hydrolase family 9 protein [Deminuibacter soli]RFM25680.1 glycosyl transferase [Deminuibacter soli]
MKRITTIAYLLCAGITASAQPAVHVNQVAYEANGFKQAVLTLGTAPKNLPLFILQAQPGGQTVYKGTATATRGITEWLPGQSVYLANFTRFTRPGTYRLRMISAGDTTSSAPFTIGTQALAKTTLPAIVQYYRRQRANTPEEWQADSALLLYGTQTRVNMQGGWCDASGDVSKYFSHLAYANFMSPQQTPLVTWSLVRVAETLPALAQQLQLTDSLAAEACWGADYMMRALSDSGYFRMVVFSYFNKDPQARRVAGLEANSITTNAWQCAYREGGGMAIAALARIARWQQHGSYTNAQYLAAAERAFAHLEVNNTRYDDDGKENIIDDYCALLAATELWITTGNNTYRDAARKRANNLTARLTATGYFIADDGTRPYWHASDAGLPVVALARYVQQEKDTALRNKAIATIRKAMTYQLQLNNNTGNPFNYARQTTSYKGHVQNSFFIPHANETGWWWQGENARLASLATAAMDALPFMPATQLNATKAFATAQLNWILGNNPYDRCFMYGFGKNNVPYMHSNYGHGSEKGGISNGITGSAEKDDGSGIDFKTADKGNEWRWTEQWIPHAAWFMQAAALIAAQP